MGQNFGLVQNRQRFQMKAENCAMILFALVMAAVGAWIAVMALDNEIPYEYGEGQITPNPAHQGSRVILNFKINVRRTCPGYVQRVLTDETTGKVIAVYDPSPAAMTVRMGDHELNKTFLLPDDLPPLVGYDAFVCFKCNKLQHFFPMCTKTPHLTIKMQQ